MQTQVPNKHRPEPSHPSLRPPASRPQHLFLPDCYAQRTLDLRAIAQMPLDKRTTGIYKLADYLIKETNLKYIVDIGCGFSEEEQQLFTHCGYIGIGHGRAVQGVLERRPSARVMHHDLTSEFAIDEAILADSVVVCDGILNQLTDPSALLATLAAMNKIAPYVLIATPDRERLNGLNHMGPPDHPGRVREWVPAEFEKLLIYHGLPCQLMGHAVHDGMLTDKLAILAVAGVHATYKKVPKKKIVAILSCYNDEDIIIDVAQHLLQEGIHIWFVDNWSTDKTWDTINKIKQAAPDRVACIERFPKEGPDQEYQWQAMLHRKEQIALDHGADYDWFIHHDSDEIRTSPWPGVSMADAISFVDSLGYNTINHLFADFRPIKDGFDASADIKKYLTHFEFNLAPSAFVQKRAWAHQPVKVELIESGGHEAKFVGRSTFPLRFLIQHFSLRSSQQAFNKIFRDRLPRFGQEERALGWHIHYDHFKKENQQKFIWKADDLVAYHPVYFNSEYILERLAALNVKYPVMRKPFDWHWD